VWGRRPRRISWRYGAIEDFPDEALKGQRERALLFKRLATLRRDAELFDDVEALRWRGPTEAFGVWATRMGREAMVERARKALDAQARG
jgi:hypothetical protein